ncbi:hypothetical protein Lal_00031534 [Lupinus albus]|nr:hypothetical protein Lal_00031534 [Lupinus albus]
MWWDEKRDPKVGGGVGRIREVAKNRTPILTKEMVDNEINEKETNTLAQVMKQYFGSSYVAMLWLKLCSNTLAQVMKQYFGSSYVAMLWLKLCSNTLAQVNRRMKYARSGALGALDFGFTIYCNKCGRLHYGSTCPGKGNGCFHCKEFGHIKRYCPKMDRRPNVMHAGEARDHGRMVTPSGAGTSGVDDPARGKRMVTDIPCLVMLIRERHTPSYMLNTPVVVKGVIFTIDSVCLSLSHADRVVAVGDLCKVSNQASGIGPMSAKKVRTLLRKRDRYSFSKCHKRSWKPRLIQRFSLERERCIGEGEIVGYSGGFSPERELYHPREK